jgi:hypothetical protein
MPANWLPERDSPLARANTSISLFIVVDTTTNGVGCWDTQGDVTPLFKREVSNMQMDVPGSQGIDVATGRGVKWHAARPWRANNAALRQVEPDGRRSEETAHMAD